ncbi:hypothetical protein CTI12_AA546780 [Artemisia annua]|uniref:Trichome birefringence-like C-terminal domain-containing protein n=1 Tax=Artemisia annua TaxID=35608 RepID=A0A2U1KZI9_ARTAN|nr:hypothetical protein CTI12_AA546780 [Artemisia annua]
MQDKRLMFVGDSVQRSMFDSMVCLVRSVIPEGNKSLQKLPPRKIFRAQKRKNVDAQDTCKDNCHLGVAFNSVQKIIPTKVSITEECMNTCRYEKSSNAESLGLIQCLEAAERRESSTPTVSSSSCGSEVDLNGATDTSPWKTRARRSGQAAADEVKYTDCEFKLIWF